MPNTTLSADDLQAFYYTAKIENLLSILQNGILSRSTVSASGFYKSQHDISSQGVQSIRHSKTFLSPRTKQKRKLNEYVNLYLQPNNAFLVVVQKETPRNELFTIRIKGEILKDREQEAVLTTKNAACHRSKFFAPKEWAPSPETSKALSQSRLSGLSSNKWVGATRFRACKQSRQSEALFPAKIDPDYFDCIFVHNEQVKGRVSEIITSLGLSIPVRLHPSLFTSPKRGAFSKSLIQEEDPHNLARLSNLLQFELESEPVSPKSIDTSFSSNDKIEEEQPAKTPRTCI